MANESWEEHRLLIMDKLSHHTAELSNIKSDLTTFKSEFQIGMTELKTKMLMATTVTNLVVGSIVAFVMGKVLG